MANNIIEEMIKKAKKASIANRGAYPVTAATNVYNQNGTPIETVTNQDAVKPDAVVDPATTPVVEVIKEVASGAVIAIIDGEVAETLQLDKGITIKGVNAGVPQNYKQEV